MFNNIYIYRSGGMGDVLWLEPVLQQLSKQYSKVYLYTNFYELYENYPFKNVIVKKIPSGFFRIFLKLLNFFSTKKKYHRIDGYCYEAFPKMHILNAYQTYFNLTQTQEYPKLYLSSKENNTRLIKEQQYAIIHLEPNAKLNFRKVYGVNWNVVVASLEKQGIKTIIVGNNPDPIDGATVFKGSIGELIQIVKNAQFFIGVDSGPSHIAASLQVPSLIFFGAVNPEFRHFAKLFQGAFLQQPCEFAGCYHEVISSSGQTCKLVGNEGIPKCCIHTNEGIINSINQLLK
jgi:heptosyltransferase-3